MDSLALAQKTQLSFCATNAKGQTSTLDLKLSANQLVKEAQDKPHRFLARLLLQ